MTDAWMVSLESKEQVRRIPLELLYLSHLEDHMPYQLRFRDPLTAYKIALATGAKVTHLDHCEPPFLDLNAKRILVAEYA